MPAQLARVRVLAAARRAPELAHARVLDEVSAQVRLAREAARAVGAVVGEDAAVAVLVHLQAPRAAEPPSAAGALQPLRLRLRAPAGIGVGGGGGGSPPRARGPPARL